ncbi:hypothetical protein GOV08_04995 [Candidatus Woesearchaeota archaeon]|nr:hypothetical protein [Candidatus Woesearchaeota archaeon]
MGIFSRDYSMSSVTKKLNNQLRKLKNENLSQNSYEDILENLSACVAEYKWIENKLSKLGPEVRKLL